MRKENNLKVLKYWLDVERSSPPIIKINRFNVKNNSNFNQLIFMNGSDKDLVWGDDLSAKLDTPSSWIHRVYIGIFNTSLIIDEFSNDPKEVNELKQSHNTCLVSFMLDSDGNPIPKTFVIPEYLTYIYRYCNKKLPESELSGFEDRINDIYSLWNSSISARGSSIMKSDILKLLKDLVIEVNWIRLSNFYKLSSPKYIGYSESISTKHNRKISFDSDITNSLISDDIKYVCETYMLSDVVSSLDYYLEQGVDNSLRVDVAESTDEYRKYLSPIYIPDAGFPYSEGIRLNVSQQYSVNKSFNLLEERGGVFSINGPPGTGKTTIFKDIIANIVYLRACELIKFRDNPESAFKKIGDISYRFGDNGEKPIYSVDSSLTGYEMVVASSNNNAIKNITDELPKNSGIDSVYVDKFKYIKKIADNIHSNDCWGLISATLGSRGNNYEFMNSFLFKTIDDDKLTTKDSIFDFLKNPKYFSESVSSWESACDLFERTKNQLDRVKARAVKISEHMNNYRSTVDLQAEMVGVQSNIEGEMVELKKRYETYKRSVEKSNIELNKIRRSIKGKSFKNNNSERLEIKEKYEAFVKKVASDKYEMLEIIDNLKILKIDYRDLIDAINENNSTIKKMDDFKNSLGGLNSDYPNDEFWELNQSVIQKASVWVDNSYSRARKNLFVASMNLHKSFIINNSHYFVSNLRTLKDILEGDFYEKDIYTKSILQTLFLMIPVLSTTLYSFNKLFNSFGAGEIGWLLIDEAGQSSPQLPVPALYKSKRAIICGDPLQIEPIINIEAKLSDALIEKNGVTQLWNSCSYSSQQIADRNNYFGTYFGLGKYRQWFGSPLRVHKRCLNPMFKISNKIAYDGKMIFDTKYDDDEKFILGDSTWFHIDSSVDDVMGHYIESEVVFLSKMLKILMKGRETLDNIFIITPFRDVMFSSQKYIIENQSNIAPQIKSTEFAIWVKNNIGTVHSFQGKEADIVFMIIGGNKSKAGAINWLSTEPNILNVSVTRARKRLYIIGNAKVWNKGVFRLIREYIKVKRVR